MIYSNVRAIAYMCVHVRAVGVKHSNKLCKQTRVIGQYKKKQAIQYTFKRRHSLSTSWLAQSERVEREGE